MNRIFNRSSEQMPELPDESVHCIVTSPPYYGLRDYGVDGQIGLEPTLNEYIAKLVACAREWRRVLRKDGTVWLNLGDSYAAKPTGTFNGGGFKDGSIGRDMSGVATSGLHDKVFGSGLKPKDLMLVPQRVAIALQADGWWIRDAIVWAKPNPMPSSVTDRCTPSYELVFHLAKSKTYYADMEAVKEPLAESSVQRPSKPTFDQQTGGAKDYAKTTTNSITDAVNPNMSARKALENLKYKHDQARVTSQQSANRVWDDAEAKAPRILAAGANLRNVWTIATEPYPEAHFATFPRELARRCIMIGCPAQCCAKCGAPYVRKTSVSYDNPGNRTTNGPRSTENRDITAGFEQRLEKRVDTLGFDATCDCGEGTRSGIVLDPFAGSGTTLDVAVGCGRQYVGYELNPEYCKLIQDRLGLFGEGVA